MSVSSTALRTDHYELTMFEAARASGVAGRRSVFELFARDLPAGRRYGVVGGIGRLVDGVDAFRFGPGEIAYLQRAGFLARATLDALAAYRFSGTIHAYREGELYFPHSPVLTVEASFGDALVLETLLLSIVNHDSAVASAAARMVDVARGRPLIEMGGRRTEEHAATASARVAYACGFAATSNLEAGRTYGVPTRGTSAHAFTLAHADEITSFGAQVAALGPETTLLVDTFDITQGIANAVRAAGNRLGAIRIDSGKAEDEARRARSLLDELGATNTLIIVSGDMDEYSIDALVSSGAPIDGFGVGTSVVTGSGHPAAGFVYKLVAIATDDGPGAPMHPVAKLSSAKGNVGGAKRAWRVLDDEGFAAEEFVEPGPPTTACPALENQRCRALQVALIDHGETVHRRSLDEIRAHHAAAIAELRESQRSITDGPPALTAAPPFPMPSAEDRPQPRESSWTPPAPS